MAQFFRHMWKTKILFKFFTFILITVLYCEYLHYYVTLVTCRWPELPVVEGSKGGVERSHGGGVEVVQAMVLADTHLLGSRNGHWFDKLRREWQMHRAFQTAVLLHSPDVVIFLGDLLDEGKWSGKEEFRDSVARFSSLFSLPSSTQLIIVPGNHDMGFHYSLNPSLVRRFERAFNVGAVTVHEAGWRSMDQRGEEDEGEGVGVVFVAVNSMALHGDDCFLCKPARLQLQQINKELQCAKGLLDSCRGAGRKEEEDKEDNHSDGVKNKGRFSTGVGYTRPILLQHYPLYRPSDEACSEDITLAADAAPPERRRTQFRERWDCLSEQASSELLELLEPRLVLSGHTHHSCSILHTHPPETEAERDELQEEGQYYDDGEGKLGRAQEQMQRRRRKVDVKPRAIIPEITVPSFSWRNNKSPSFSMITLSKEHHAVYKCEMPREQTVVMLYCAACCCFLLSLPRRKLWLLAPVIYICTTLFHRKKPALAS